MAKSEPFSIRLSEATNELITREARRTRRSKGAVLEALADEALRTRRFPGIAFRGADWNRRPWVIGTSLDVWEIVRAAREFASAKQMAASTDLTEAQIRLALAYYEDYREEIDQAIAEGDRSVEELRLEYPTVATIPID